MKAVVVGIAAWVMVIGVAGHVAAQAGQRAGGAAAATASAAAGPVVVFDTAKGSFAIQFFNKEAPKSVEHIVTLVKRNFYNGLRVHRVEPGFVVQFGDPLTRDMTKRDRWGQNGSGRPIGVAEISPKHTHKLGAVALAHAGDPRGGDSQIYICLNGPARYQRPYAPLDGNYAVIGQVISGMDVVQKLQEPDLIRRATVQGPAAAKK